MIPLDALRKLAMHSRFDVHESDVTVSCDGTPKDIGVDHALPPSWVTRNRGPFVAESRTAQVNDA